MQISKSKKDLNWWLEWSATAIAIAGAVCTVIKYDPLNIMLLNTASILFAYWAWRIEKMSLFIVNSGLLIVYGTGAAMRALGY